MFKIHTINTLYLIRRLCKMTIIITRLRVVPYFSSGMVSERNASARENHCTREKGRHAGELSPPGIAFLAWGDFHARLRFARSTTSSPPFFLRDSLYNNLLRRLVKSLYQIWNYLLHGIKQYLLTFISHLPPSTHTTLLPLRPRTLKKWKWRKAFTVNFIVKTKKSWETLGILRYHSWIIWYTMKPLFLGAHKRLWQSESHVACLKDHFQ